LQMDVPYQIGDKVKLKEEELWGIEGEIININKDTWEVQIKTKLMGRETIVNVTFDKIDKITN
jgi:transcription antitermination factor NusG